MWELELILKMGPKTQHDSSLFWDILFMIHREGCNERVSKLY